MARSQTLLIDIGQGLYKIVGYPTLATWETKDRPKGATRGTVGFNLQTNNLEYWNGKAWLAVPMEEA